MEIELPIFRQISFDGTLPPRAYQVWRAAIEQLDLVEYRSLKFASVEVALDLDRSTVFRAITTLLERGYLVRTDGKYRVPLSRGPAVSVAAVDEAAPAKAPSSKKIRPRVHSNGVF